MFNFYQRRDILALSARGLLPGVQPWFGSDQPSLFDHNCRTNPEQMLPWRDRVINYTLNSRGFRTPEFSEVKWNHALVLFGCSVAFGEGLDDAACLAGQLAQMVDRPVINMGISGAGSRVIAANQLKLYHMGVKPWRVVTIWPTADRLTEFCPEPDAAVVCHGSWIFTKDPKETWTGDPRSRSSQDYHVLAQLSRWRDIYQLVNQDNLQRNQELILDHHTVQALWGDRNRHWAWAPETAELLNVGLLDWWNIQDLARDLKHPGAESQKDWAQRIAREL